MWKKVADAIGVALFATLFGVFVVQIVARFGFDRPLPWTDELAVVLYVWVILWAAAVMVPEDEHVAFDLLFNLAGRRARRWMAALGALIVGALAAWALPATWDYVHFMAREGTPVLNLSFMWVFMPFVLLMAVLVLRAVAHLRRLFTEADPS